MGTLKILFLWHLFCTLDIGLMELDVMETEDKR